MDRFTWYQAGQAVSEDILIQAGAVCLYNGDQKTAFETGTVSLTPIRLIWADSGDPNCRLSLHHSLVTHLERHHRSLMRSAKMSLHLAPTPAHLQGQGPVTSSKYAYVKLSFRHGGDEELFKRYREALDKKEWQRPGSGGLPSRQANRVGVTGIERRLAEQHVRTSQNISQAFEDLSKLMETAKDMVHLSKSISEKLRNRQGEITEDETVKFKSYLLGLGVSDPVTKSTHGSGASYYKELAKELSSILEIPLKEAGGMITLPDVYCRVNRARGFELLSPEDVLNAVYHLQQMDLPVKLHKFDSGVLVLQLADRGVDSTVDETSEVVETNTSLTAQELGQLIGISVILARERLLAVENYGNLCRDETIEGLRFYPNMFVRNMETVPEIQETAPTPKQSLNNVQLNDAQQEKTDV